MSSVTGVEAGQAIYSRLVLSIYDLYVLGLSNHLIWRCPTRRLLDNYDAHASARHLDVGVGTGYFLDKCCFPVLRPALTLLDLNPNSLAASAKRLRHYQPQRCRHNIFEPLPFKGEQFDSIGINYLLHCLPGSMEDKAVVFDHLLEVLAPGGVLFGSSLVQGTTKMSPAARKLMALYNRKGIFSNRRDTTEALERILAERFADYSLEQVGSVAIFSAAK
jgi:ubiquinone/menaquinone biosynthesis C-methylase UbiE